MHRLILLCLFVLFLTSCQKEKIFSNGTAPSLAFKLQGNPSQPFQAFHCYIYDDTEQLCFYREYQGTDLLSLYTQGFSQPVGQEGTYTTVLLACGKGENTAPHVPACLQDTLLAASAQLSLPLNGEFYYAKQTVKTGEPATFNLKRLVGQLYFSLAGDTALVQSVTEVGIELARGMVYEGIQADSTYFYPSVLTAVPVVQYTVPVTTPTFYCLPTTSAAVSGNLLLRFDNSTLKRIPLTEKEGFHIVPNRKTWVNIHLSGTLSGDLQVNTAWEEQIIEEYIQGEIDLGTSIPDTLICSPEKISGIPFGGATLPLFLSASSAWEITSIPGWITANPSRGNGKAEEKIELTFSPNDSSDNRSGEILFTQGGKNFSLPVIQKGNPNYLPDCRFMNLSNPWQIPAKGGTFSYIWQANGAFFSLLHEVDWMEYRSDFTPSPQEFRSGNEVTFTFRENTSASPRSFPLYVSYYGDTCRVYQVIQAGAEDYLEIPYSSWEVKAKGATTTLNVTANTSWTATASGNWIQFTRQPSTGNVTPVAITVLPNTDGAREGTLTFSVPGQNLNQVFHINQKAYIPTTYPFALKYKIKLKASWDSGKFVGINYGTENYANTIIYTSFTYANPKEAMLIASNLYGFVTDAPYARQLETPETEDPQFYVPNYQGSATTNHMELSICYNNAPYLRRCAVNLPVPANLKQEDELIYTIHLKDIIDSINFKYNVEVTIR